MYYGILTVSVVMFGTQFLTNERYEKLCGNHIGAAFMFSLISALSGFGFLALLNGFQIKCTSFTVVCAFISALNSLLYTVCSLKALSRINLSLYSLLAMLGGMLLPFFAGLFFYNEMLTLGKGICVILIIIALALGVSRKRKSGGLHYYIGVFVLNGMSGVISKFFESAPFPKAGAADFSILTALLSALLSGVILFAVRKQIPKINGKAFVLAFSGGVLSRVANFLLLIALAVLPASAQYPFVTGGVMIVSTLLALLIGQKPSFKELLSVLLAFLGILALTLF